MTIPLITAFLVSASLVLAPTAVLARDDTGPTPRADTVNCEKISATIDRKVQQAGEGKGKHQGTLSRLQERLERLENRLRSEGYDTTQLNQDLEALEGKIQKFNQDYVQYLQRLQAAKTDQCGKTPGEFRGKLQFARAEQKIVREDLAGIREFYRTTIKD